MTYIHITGNFAKEGQCGRCSNMMLVGCVTGVCKANNYEDCMTEDNCNCGKYTKGEPDCE